MKKLFSFLLGLMAVIGAQASTLYETSGQSPGATESASMTRPSPRSGEVAGDVRLAASQNQQAVQAPTPGLGVQILTVTLTPQISGTLAPTLIPGMVELKKKDTGGRAPVTQSVTRANPEIKQNKRMVNWLFQPTRSPNA